MGKKKKKANKLVNGKYPSDVDQCYEEHKGRSCDYKLGLGETRDQLSDR